MQKRKKISSEKIKYISEFTEIKKNNCSIALNFGSFLK
jgi:hypothetical protein